MSARVMPTATRSVCNAEEIYELRPACQLPKLNLSLSIKSRFLSRPALNAFNAFVAFPGLKLAGIVGMVSYFLMFFVPVKAGRVLAVVSTLLYMPNIVAAFSLLRVEVVTLMLGTFDFWFASFINLTTFAVFAAVMDDARGLAMLGAWAGTVNNILIDANIRIIKVWVIFNIIAAVMHGITWAMVSLDVVDHLDHGVLLRFGDRELGTHDYVTAGLATIIALILRNVFRKRHAFRKDADRAVIECVSYRTDLKYVSLRCVVENTAAVRSERGVQEMPEFIKTMCYMDRIGPVLARSTLLRSLWVQRSVLVPSHPRAGQIFAAFGAVAALMTVASTVTMLAVSESLDNDSILLSVLQAVELVSLLLTMVYCTIFELHLQRSVLVALYTSFDFAFLSAQLLVVHVGLVDHMRSCRCGFWTVATWWFWIHWLLTIDAATPVMRHKLGLTKAFALAVLLAYICASIVLVLKLVSANSMEAIYHRVVWSTIALSRKWEMRLAPLYCNCLATVVVLCLRLLWRLSRNGFDVLLVLNGATTYENYMLKQRAKNREVGSIRFGSTQSPAQPTRRYRRKTTKRQLKESKASTTSSFMIPFPRFSSSLSPMAITPSQPRR